MDNANQHDALVANIAALKATIERRQIVAPFDGITGIVKVNVGEYVTVGTEIVRVEDRQLDASWFFTCANELKNLYIGQKVTATTDALPSESFSATITTIEPAINTSTGLIDLLSYIWTGRSVKNYYPVCSPAYNKSPTTGNKPNCRPSSLHQLQYVWRNRLHFNRTFCWR